MINAVIFDNQIKIWWDYNKLYSGCSYRIINDGKEFSTTASHYCFKELTPNTEYNFIVDLVDKDGNILKHIGAQAFKTKNTKNIIDVTKAPYNAVGDGKTICTKALQAAINDCTEDDMLFFPDGIYLTGALDLHSNTELRLSDNATIQGTTNVDDYLPLIRNRGTTIGSYRSLLNAGTLDEYGGYNCYNITIVGGKIIGGGDELRIKTINVGREAALKKLGGNDPSAEQTAYEPGARRGRLLCFFNTQNVILADCYLGNSPGWNIHPVFCDNVVTCNCTIFSHKISNGDGWDPESSTNCTLFGVYFDTGDDCIAIKSGHGKAAHELNRPSKNIKIFDCTSHVGHGVAIGSEMSGGVEDVTIWNCDFRTTTVGVSLKTNPWRGGYMKNIRFYNFIAPTITLALYPPEQDSEAAPCPPVLDGLHFEDITLTGITCNNYCYRFIANNAVDFNCYDYYKIKNVTLKNIKLMHRAILTYQALYLNNVENLTLENITCLGEDVAGVNLFKV